MKTLRSYLSGLSLRALSWFFRRTAPIIEREALKHPGVIDTKIHEWPEYGPVLYIEATDEEYEAVAEKFATGDPNEDPGRGRIRMARDAEEAIVE